MLADELHHIRRKRTPCGCGVSDQDDTRRIDATREDEPAEVLVLRDEYPFFGLREFDNIRIHRAYLIFTDSQNVVALGARFVPCL
jgi:hypothetical protein